jgi:hypothetical protein
MNITGNGFLGPWSIPVKWRFRQLGKQALLTPFFLLLEYKLVSIHLLCFTEVRKNFEKWYKMSNECMLAAVVEVPVVAVTASRMICFA